MQLLAALGGQAALRVDASKELKWQTPVCADTISLSGPQRGALQVWDYDFFKNVLKPVCEQFQADRPDATIDCSFTKLLGTTEKYLEISKQRIGNRQVFKLESCTQLAETQSSIFRPQYEVSFAAPAAWGFAPGQAAWLYEQDAASKSTWRRDAVIQIHGVDDAGKCGEHALETDSRSPEVCVHATFDAFGYGGRCKAIATGEVTVGAAQSEGTNGLLRYTLP